MGFLDKFFKQKPENPTEKIMEDRDKIKQTLSANLSKIGFTRLEIQEVLEVVSLAEADIEAAKHKLIGSNINNPDPTKIMHTVYEEIRVYQRDMAYNVQQKIAEIKQRKSAVKKASEFKGFPKNFNQ